ncbi:N-acetylneuraminate synthase family protein [Chloroflexota bacterium]
MIERTRIIAEAASNHGGNLKLAKKMIKIAAESGADYIKFQSWQAETLREGEKDPQYKWFKKAELSDEAHYELIEECRQNGIKFLTTCFNLDRVSFLVKLALNEIKVGSPDASSLRMLAELKEHFDHIIISTGMAFEEELHKTAELLGKVNFTLLHCVSVYPTPHRRVNLQRMDWLRQFTPSVGYSDHCVGTEAVKLAIARGAKYIEKHFSLGEKEGCRASPWDATPQELESTVRFAEDCRLMLGEESFAPEEEEREARDRFIGRWGNNR